MGDPYVLLPALQQVDAYACVFCTCVSHAYARNTSHRATNLQEGEQLETQITEI
jgi:hypothetical protein